MLCRLRAGTAHSARIVVRRITGCRLPGLAAASAAALGGCGYDTDVLGLYFPSWVVSPLLGGAVAGLLLHAVEGTAARPYLGNRALLFCSLTVSFSVAIWWAFFRG